jgi:iron complex outermembrane recepter protein
MKPRLDFLHIFFVFMLFTNICYAQNDSVKISVKSKDKLALPGAPVVLTGAKDSLTVYEVTNQDGHAYFTGLEDGIYILNITYIGFKPVETTIRVTPVLRTYEFILGTDVISLEGVSITAHRPLIRQEDDKMIIDPEPMVSISTNTLEILENTPGIYVDQEGGIYLTSATAAVVYINGREQKMSNQDIQTLLRSLPPHSVERIEVLRTPSAKFDATSSGGIINIILKKGVKLGRFGSFNAGMNQGKAGNRYAGFSINNSGENTTSYLNFNYNLNNRFEEIHSVRYLRTDTFIDQAAESIYKHHALNLMYGLNYEPKHNLNISYDGRINAGLRSTEAENINFLKTSENIVLSQSLNNIENKILSLNIQQDFGLKIQLDTTGSEIDTKISYSYITNASQHEYSTQFIFPADFLMAGNGDNNIKRTYFVVQSDLTSYLPYKFKLESGIKQTYQFFINDADFLILENGTYVSDMIRTNSYSYRESISSAYLQASRKLIADIQLKTGIRLEHTSMNGNQLIPVDTGFVVRRADFFPYIYLSRKVADLMGIKLFGYMIYRRTIHRPGYQELNPTIRYIDQFLYETGNPSLTPQFTDNIEANISFNDMPVFAIGRNVTKDIFSMVMYNDEQTEGLLVRTYDNIGKNSEIYLRGIAGIPPGGKYFFAVGAQYSMNEYTGLYDNEPYTFTNASWRFFTFHSLTLFKETKLTASGFLMKNGVWNFYKLEDFGQINLGLSRNFLNKKLTVSIHARDILNTNINRFQYQLGSVKSSGERYSDNRRLGINIRYNFGIKKNDEKKGFNGFDEDVQ